MLTKTEQKLKEALDKHTKLCDVMLNRRLTLDEENLLVNLETKIDRYSDILEKQVVPANVLGFHLQIV